MKRTRLVILAVSLVSAMWNGCSSSPQASTEVENEIVLARSVAGVAMDSAAVDSASWSVWSQSGILLSSGTTDSVGQFVSDTFTTTGTSLLVRVVRNQDTLRSLMVVDSSNTTASVASILVHSLTEAAVEKVLTDPRLTRFSSTQAQNARTAGQNLLQNVIGLQLSWDSLQSNRAFRPIKDNQSETSSPTAALLRALAVRSSRDQKHLGNWLTNRGPGKPVIQDSLFAQDLFESLERANLDSASQQIFLQQLEHQGPANTNLQDGWRKHRTPPPPPPPPGGQDSTRLN